MADEKKEPWLTYLAISTVILAVCATLSSFKGSSCSTKSVVNQAMASDQGAFFQAKSIKGYIYEAQKDNMQLALQAHAAQLPASVSAATQARIADYDSKITRYEAEKGQIQEEAKKLENARDRARQHSQLFGMAVIFLQIAILLSSIAALMKRPFVWILGLLVGLVGVGYFIYAWLIFVD